MKQTQLGPWHEGEFVSLLLKWACSKGCFEIGFFLISSSSSGRSKKHFILPPKFVSPNIFFASPLLLSQKAMLLDEVNTVNVLGFLHGINWYSFEVVPVSGFQSGIKLWGRNHKSVLISLSSRVDS